MRIVVLSPHRGDAALSLGLAISGWLQAGATVEVLNAFTETAHAPFSDVDFVHENDRQSFATAVRRREDAAWNKVVGGKLRFVDLGLLDAPLRLQCSLEMLSTEPIRAGDRAQARLAGSLAKLARTAAAGTGAFAFAVPLAAGGHIDHRIAREAALDALGSTGLPLAFYEDWPASANSADERLLPEAAASTGLALQPIFAPPESLEREALKSAAARKRRMALAYDSQLDTEAVTAAGAAALRWAGRERLWANPPWLQAFQAKT